MCFSFPHTQGLNYVDGVTSSGLVTLHLYEDNIYTYYHSPSNILINEQLTALLFLWFLPDPLFPRTCPPALALSKKRASYIPGCLLVM